MKRFWMALVSALIATLALAAASFAKEFPIGKPHAANGMKVAAVYLQPVEMDPMFDIGREEADIHLEADVSALKGNKNGLAEGAWVPYLTIRYVLINQQTGATVTGILEPMFASDGPHYGAQVKMPGQGKYKLIYYINPPNYKGIARHTDKETGISPWWSPFKAEWEFTYLGFGKKGGY